MSYYAILDYRICSKCRVEKSLSEFYKRKRNKDGYNRHCKQCCGKKTNKNRTKVYSYYDDNGIYHKVCNMCKTLKSFDNFSIDRGKKDRLQSVCKDCFKQLNGRGNKKSKSKYKYKEIQKVYKKKWSNKKAKYQTTTSKSISWHDYTECSEDGFLIVKCRYCGKKFIPKNRDVDNRSHAINIKGTDNQGLYCSSGCKKACPTYRRAKYHKRGKIEGSSREVQPQLRQMCLERDGYACQKCNAKGKTVQLHCHHIYPLNESPITSADVNDCITLCKSCHKKAHKIPGCGYNDLKC